MGKKLNFEQNIIMKIISINIYIFYASTAKAEIVKQITIEGNKRISDETVRFMEKLKITKIIQMRILI